MFAPDPDAEARRLAREGYGWEDVRFILGVTEHEARAIVFGKAAAIRMEARERSKVLEVVS